MKLSYSLPLKIKMKSVTFEETLGFIYLILFAGFAALNLLSGTPLPFGLIFRIYRYIAMAGILGIIILKNRYSFIKASLIAVIAIAFFIVANVTQKSTLIVSGLFVASAGITKFEKIVKTSLIATVPSLLFVIACSKVGIIPDHLFMHEGHVAHSLGFSYYGTVPYIVLFCLISCLYLRGNRLSWIEIGAMLLVNKIVYIVTTTRLAYFLFFIVLLFFILLVKFNIIDDLNKLIYRFLALIGFPLVFSFTVWISLQYSPTSTIMRKINEFSSNRVIMSYKAFQMYDVKMFGQYIEMHGNGYGDNGIYFYIDSGYIYTLLGNGILFTVIILAIYSFLLWISCKTNKKELFVWIIAIMAFSIINNVLTNITYNSALMAFMPMIALMKDKKKGSNDELLKVILGRNAKLYSKQGG
ncbi:MAG TPA: hypothetical protein P5092_12110 [Ruminococcus sp.]|nr:hypothetical protein [Ruminococcus sp.]